MAHASYYVVSACGELLLGLSCVDSCQPLDTGIEVFVQYRKTIIANLLTLPKLQDELTLANFSISSGLKLRNPDAHYIISENHAFGIELLTGFPDAPSLVIRPCSRYMAPGRFRFSALPAAR